MHRAKTRELNYLFTYSRAFIIERAYRPLEILLLHLRNSCLAALGASCSLSLGRVPPHPSWTAQSNTEDAVFPAGIKLLKEAFQV